MLRLIRKQRRLITAFLLINMIQSLMAPAISYALTAGPTAPETTDFEPIDTSDMVNLATGEFTYSVPLLEVPSPEGGYPISLAYHGGIRPLEDASWVGLGWSLNPGAINRIVNGWPDDHNNINKKVEDYWAGGTTDRFSVGISVGLPSNLGGVGLSVSVSHDTYAGFGGDVGLDFNLLGVFSFGIDAGSSGVGANFGVGLSYHGVGGGLNFSSTGDVTASLSYGGLKASTDFKGNGSVGISAGGASMGISFNSKGVTGVTMGVQGVSMSVGNSNAGKISTSSFSIGIPIPIPYTPLWLNIGYSHRRYWMHEFDYVNTYGTLYAKDAYGWTAPTSNTLSNANGPRNRSMDSYAMLEYDKGFAFSSQQNPEKQLGGSFPSYDSYQVSGQGIGGVMQPYIFENASLFRQLFESKNSSTGNIEWIQTNYAKNNAPNKKVNFRFLNDFSNTVDFPTGSISYSSLWVPNFATDTFKTPVPNSEYPRASVRGSAENETHIAGSKHIEWYTNQQINNIGTTPIPGFINTADISNTDRTTINGYNIQSQIGGFCITNESGVTYHYTLPVYSYDEYSKHSKTDAQNVESYNRQDSPHPYAYTWMLTAITGPDFVDVNNDKLANDGDYGYWMTFHYGKWSNEYQWRTPGIGVDKDITTFNGNGSGGTYTYGKKQIYYLDAIRSRSHTAYFVKEIREDGKGINDSANGGWIQNGYMYVQQVCTRSCAQNGDCPPITTGCKKRYQLNGVYPVSVMKLNKILLYKNSDLGVNENVGTLEDNGTSAYSQLKSVSRTQIYNDCVDCECYDNNTGGTNVITATYSNCSTIDTLNVRHHYENNVVDISDIPTALEQKAIKSIQLNTDYSLCKETPNSFANNFYTGGAWPTVKNGKLTLNSITYKGTNGVISMPPLKFSYDNPEPTTTSNATTSTYNIPFPSPYNNQTIVALPFSPSVDDIVTFTQNSDGSGTRYWVRIVSNLLSNQFGQGVGYAFVVLGASNPASGFTFYKAKITKNPPYKADAYDWWGYYKTDYSGASQGALTEMARKPTALSSKHVDAWCLRNIQTSLGSIVNIDYSVKSFTDDVVRSEDIILNPSSVTTTSGGSTINSTTIGAMATIRYSFNTISNLSTYFTVGQPIRIVLPVDVHLSSGNVYQYGTIYDQVHSVSAVNATSIDVPLSILHSGGVLCHNGGTNPAPLSYGTSVNVLLGLGYVVPKQDLTQDDGIGDGIKVNSITVSNSAGTETRKTIYTYQDGVTSYIPGYDQPSASTFPVSNCLNNSLQNSVNNTYKKYHTALSREIPAPGVMYKKVTVTEKHNNIDVPGSKVYEFKPFEWGMVGYIASGETTSGAGTTASPWLGQRTVTVKNKTSQVGALLSQKVYDGKGNLVSSVKNNYADANYNTETDYEEYHKQGIVEQVFNETRFTYNGSYMRRYGVISKRVDYPNIIKSVETYANGRTSTVYNRAFDFFSGEQTVVETLTDNNDTVRTVNVPAYRVNSVYKNGDGSSTIGMGLKLFNSSNKHMLSQLAGVYKFKVSSWYNKSNTNAEIQGLRGLMSATVTTWGRDWSYRDYNTTSDKYVLTSDATNRVWRKQKEWVFKADAKPSGTLNVNLPTWAVKASGSSLINFDPGNETLNATNGWQKTSEVTYYDRFSKPLEEMDINGNYASAKMGHNNTRALSTASLSKYCESAFSSAEDLSTPETNVNFFGGGVQGPSPTYVVTTKAHTGDKSVLLNASTNEYGFNYKADIGTGADQISRKKYVTNLWVDAATAQNDRSYIYCNIFNGSTSIKWISAKINDANAKLVGGWYLLTLPIDLTAADVAAATRIEIGTWASGQTTSTYIDDFRFKPLDGSMSSYVYDAKTDLVRFILNNDHLFTEYRYDAAGRLIGVFQETPENPTGKRAVSQHVYHYYMPKQ